jgi:hypothetical protein
MKLLLAAACIAAFLSSTIASAAIGVSLNRTHARVGDRVRADVGAGWGYLSLYLAPDSEVSDVGSCPPGYTGSCAPWSIGPPHERDWVWIGRFFPRRPSFVFAVPRLRPGLYRPVVYCAPCYRCAYGSLIAGTRTLRVKG